MALLLWLLIPWAASLAAEPNHDDKEVVAYLNSQQNLFEAGPPTMSEEEFESRLMDTKYLEDGEVERVFADEVEINEKIPESFQAKDKWPECKSITTIRDQANCGSCWAVSGASAMSDRLCIQSNYTKQTILSDTDLLACCGAFCGSGCEGGWMTRAWDYVKKSGVCSGGPYNQKNVCKPYAFHPCGHHVNQTYYGECKVPNEKTPQCRTTCQLHYRGKYEDDKVYAKSSYSIPFGENAIKKEIMKYGPVQAGFIVYEDFRYYKKGIYKHVYGKKVGGHAIKIVGWGVENGTKYWTISNSWNSDWGENGYFRMLRGTNQCMLEGWANAGMMLV